MDESGWRRELGDITGGETGNAGLGARSRQPGVQAGGWKLHLFARLVF